MLPASGVRIAACALVFGLMLLQLALHHRLDATPLPAPVIEDEVLPTPKSLQFVSLGYDNLAADYYWLRALEYFGPSRANDIGYPLLEPLIRRVLTLDPKFKSAYIFAGAALTLPHMDPHKSVVLLEQGVRERPDVWEIGYYLGFNLYYFEQKYAEAAIALQRAARVPGAPPIVARLATRVAAEAGRPEIGMQLIDSILESTTDPKLRENYIERRKALQLDYEMSGLERLVVRYREQYGRAPARIDDLVVAGYLRGVPVDPFGKPYSIAPDGSIKSVSSALRLHLYKAP